jgi:hypothetical protein
MAPAPLSTLVFAVMGLAADPAPAAADSPQGDRLAVLIVAERGVTSALADNLTEVAISRIAEHRPDRLVGSAELRHRMAIQGDEQAIACLRNDSCVKRMAAALGVRRVVSGSIRREKESAGERYLVNLVLTDVERGAVESRFVRVVDGTVPDLVRAVQDGVEAIFRTGGEQGRALGRAEAAAPERMAPALAQAPPARAQPDSAVSESRWSRRTVVTLTLLAAGAAIGAGAGGLHLWNDDRHDRWRAEDRRLVDAGPDAATSSEWIARQNRNDALLDSIWRYDTAVVVMAAVSGVCLLGATALQLVPSSGAHVSAGPNNITLAWEVGWQ